MGRKRSVAGRGPHLCPRGRMGMLARAVSGGARTRNSARKGGLTSESAWSCCACSSRICRHTLQSSSCVRPAEDEVPRAWWWSPPPLWAACCDAAGTVAMAGAPAGVPPTTVCVMGRVAYEGMGMRCPAPTRWVATRAELGCGAGAKTGGGRDADCARPAHLVMAVTSAKKPTMPAMIPMMSGTLLVEEVPSMESRATRGDILVTWEWRGAPGLGMGNGKSWHCAR